MSDQGVPVSVLMPVYNRKEYVREAVESILGQTFGEFEFIIVNDGSTDGVGDILRDYAARDRRIVLIEQENTGYSRALNRGLGVARGEFVARMDSDDVALPERFALQVEYLRRHPEVVVLGGQGVLIDEDGDVVRPIARYLTHAEIEGPLLEYGTDGRGALIHPSVMLRRAAAVAIGGYRPEFEPAEDRDMWLRMGEIGRLANLPETLVKYRRHGGSVSETRAKQQREKAMRAIEEAHARRGLGACNKGHWRVIEREGTAAAQHEHLALVAAEHGNYATARKHAARALRRAPFRRRAWKALTIGVVGRGVAARLGQARRWMLGVGRAN